MWCRETGIGLGERSVCARFPSRALQLKNGSLFPNCYRQAARFLSLGAVCSQEVLEGLGSLLVVPAEEYES